MMIFVGGKRFIALFIADAFFLFTSAFLIVGYFTMGFPAAWLALPVCYAIAVAIIVWNRFRD